MAIFTLASVDSSEPDYSLEYELGGSTFTLELLYNKRNDSWYLTIIDDDTNPILQGQRIGTDATLNQYVIGDIPGALQCVAIDRSTEDPGVDDLGSRCIVMYITADDETLNA